MREMILVWLLAMLVVMVGVVLWLLRVIVNYSDKLGEMREHILQIEENDRKGSGE